MAGCETGRTFTLPSNFCMHGLERMAIELNHLFNDDLFVEAESVLRSLEDKVDACGDVDAVYPQILKTMCSELFYYSGIE